MNEIQLKYGCKMCIRDSYTTFAGNMHLKNFLAYDKQK